MGVETSADSELHWSHHQSAYQQQQYEMNLRCKKCSLVELDTKNIICIIHVHLLASIHTTQNYIFGIDPHTSRGGWSLVSLKHVLGGWTWVHNMSAFWPDMLTDGCFFLCSFSFSFSLFGQHSIFATFGCEVDNFHFLADCGLTSVHPHFSLNTPILTRKKCLRKVLALSQLRQVPK